MFVEVKVNIEITSEDIDDIRCAALEGGITYWCSTAKVVGDYLGEYAHEQISRGGQLKLYDIEGDRVGVLTLDKLLEGIGMYIEKANKPMLMYETRLDTSMIGASEADEIVQYALFGEIIYS